MSNWATKRKLSYVGAFFVLVFVGLALPTFFTVYEPPTCFDREQNQGEEDIDCGGPCSILCPANALSPIILWQRAFKVLPGMYSSVAYVENPNLNSSAEAIPYIFKFYDENGDLIYERVGVSDIPPNKIFPIFEDGIDTGDKTPFRVTFEFTKEAVWRIEEKERPILEVKNQILSEDEFYPRVVAVIENPSTNPVYDVEVVALVYDSKENAIAASRTFIDKLDKKSGEEVTFTWPESLDLGVGACEKPADVVLVIDRSGSMDDDALSPPEPFTSVKNAAVSFIGEMKDTDKVGVVSFATSATYPIESSLTSDLEGAKNAIGNLAIATDGPQNTNIGEGILAALDELSIRHSEISKPVIVLLTDGIPSHPVKEGDPAFAENYALEQSKKARENSIELYVIGLGTKVNSMFLKTLASSPDHYFETAEKGELEKIYRNIATQICNLGPTKIQIIPKVK